MPGATVEIISRVRKHPNADSLDLAEVLGFQCVVPISTYKEGEKIIFIHPDNVLPVTASWSQPFLKYAKHRVRAMKIRNEWSEGIIMKLGNPDILGILEPDKNSDTDLDKLQVGYDLSQILGVTHYERGESGSGTTNSNGSGSGSNGSGSGSGSLPHNIPKTDEERWENLKGMINNEWLNKKIDVTLKIDGQSWSAFYHLGKNEFGVCGRRITHNIEESNDYTEHIKRFDLQTSLTKYCQEKGVSLCIRGESYGHNIQKCPHNPHSKLEKNLAIFSVYLIDEHRYAYRNDPFYFTRVAADLGLPTVPIIEENVELTHELIAKYSTGCDTIMGQPFEGVVIKGSDFSFKIINKNYDSKK
jgi:RNA ligase (TIGR02306 family)